jgi:heterodisulfide reductase subunit C2
MTNREMLAGPPSPSNQDLQRRFLDQAREIPGGERISRCLQCGTCTGSCPVSYAMDISPRMVIALFRAGEMEKIFRSRTIWVCASCYMCTTRCPQAIKITDLLYALKRTAMEEGLYPDRFPAYRLSKNFVRIVNRYGRNNELLLLVRYYLERNPLELLRLLPLGLQLLRRGRVSLFPRKIRGVQAIRKIMEASKSLKLSPEQEALEYEKSMVGYRAVG